MFARKSSTRKSLTGKPVPLAILALVLGPLSLFAQSASPAANLSPATEFPVTMRQNVVAGTTPAGTKVEARLSLATLVKGTVIPEGATLSGEVVSSSAKTATDPSRLAVRMDSLQWKKGSLEVKLYLTGWYYPVRTPNTENQDDSNMGGRLASNRNIGNIPSIPDPLPPITANNLSSTRVVMKNVEHAVDAEGIITLTSTHSNIKLDKSTTYVFAAADLAAKK